jgi:hypothetical protein
MSVSGLAVVAVMALFLLRAEQRMNAALALGSIACSVFACNLLLVVHERMQNLTLQGRRIAAAKRVGSPFDTRSILEVVDDLRRDGEGVYPAAFPEVLLSEKPDEPAGTRGKKIFPLTGIANVTTVYCNEGGTYAIYRSDRYGLNNDDRVYLNGHPRILVLGDSYAQGACVQPGEDVASRLRQQGYDAITLGIGGNGPLLELAGLREYGPHLKPDAVFWLFSESNDLLNLVNEYRHPLLRQYLNEGFSQGLIDRQDEVDALWKTVVTREMEKMRMAHPPANAVTREEPLVWQLARQISAKDLVSLSSLRRLAGLETERFVEGERLALLRSVLERAKADAGAYGARLFLVYLPTISDRRPSSYAKILSLADALHIGVIDFEEMLKEDRDRRRFFPLRLSGHYEAEGYQRLARAMAEALDGGEHVTNR